MSTQTLSKKKVKTFTYAEVLKSAVEWFKGDDLAATTWMNKYAMKDKNGDFVEKTPDEMHRRMAREFARIEAYYKDKCHLNGSFKKLSAYGQKREFLSEERIFELFSDFQYTIPQGSVMAALGEPLYHRFVIKLCGAS
jgi:ribonucleoside-diphosphate reductase alpha chain